MQPPASVDPFRVELPQAIQPKLVVEDVQSVALKNRLTYAIKYNRPGGKVSLEVDESEAGRPGIQELQTNRRIRAPSVASNDGPWPTTPGREASPLRARGRPEGAD